MVQCHNTDNELQRRNLIILVTSTLYANLHEYLMMRLVSTKLYTCSDNTGWQVLMILVHDYVRWAYRVN